MTTPQKRKSAKRAATLADVGRVAGVSAMAASAVLNGARTSSRISPDTRARILAAAQKLHYRPNAAARALVARRMNTIGIAVVVDEGELNTYFLEVFNGIIDGAALHEQNTTVFALHDWDKDAPARLPRLCDGRIDGMILVAPRLTPEAARALPDHAPFITLHANHPIPGVVNLESDEETGAYNVVRHLLDHGHRRIMHVTGDRGLLGAERRIRGYQRALADAGLPLDPSLLVNSEFYALAGRRSIQRWMTDHAGEPLPEAIFCANDCIAMGVIEVLAEIGATVPDAVSLVGFDDTLSARTTVPQLTTVRQPLRAMGRQAVETLLQQVRSDPGGTAMESGTSIVFPTELVLRQSVGDRRPPM